ncbi:MAG TPA: xanthine dehydrogenase family protein subunit M, partial [Anaerolineae bacterium]|nr:xanthine dehydrogenase family protein subunit M [Anaerolineae bacterium]
RGGERWIPASEFFAGLFTTTLNPDDLLVEIALPPLPPRSGWSFQEVARQHGAYALAGVASVVTLDGNHRCKQARIAFLGVGDGPVDARQAAQTLIGQTPTPEAIRAAAETAATADVDPGSDIHASAEFRRSLVNVLTRRSLTEAFDRAQRV